MEYVYAVLLLHKAKQPISEESVTKVLQAAGVSVDAAKVKGLVASLEGVNIEDALAKAVVAAAPASGGAAPAEAKKEEPKEEKKTEEEAAAGLASLFG